MTMVGSNLNPIERLWKWMNERIIYHTYHEDFEDFQSVTISFAENVLILDHKCPLGQAFAS